MKRFLSCFMAIVFLSAMVLYFPADVFLLKTSAAANDYANDAEHYFVNDIKVYPSYFNYEDYYSPVTGEQVGMYANYNDDMFDTDANYESTDLAKLGICLASWAYNESGITAAYKRMGYSSVTENYDITSTYDNNDIAAFTLGYKQVDNTNYFLCTVRGTSSNCEWFSDFNVGPGTAHAGFNKAAGKIMDSLEEYLDIYAETGNGSRNVILITGHSRGAAIANILGTWLTNTSSYFSSSDIFCYTYACPAVTQNPDTSLTNIRNYNNPGDTVTAIPLSTWGYGRNGIDIFLNTTGEVFDNFKYQFKYYDELDYSGTDNTTNLTTVLQAIAPDVDTFNTDRDQLIFGIVAAHMASNGDNSDFIKYASQVINDHVSINEVALDKLLDIFTNGLSSKISASVEITSILSDFKNSYLEQINHLNEVRDAAKDAINAWPEYVQNCEDNDEEPSFNEFYRMHSEEFSDLAIESKKSFDSIEEAKTALSALEAIIGQLTLLEDDSFTAIDLLFAMIGSTAEELPAGSNLYDSLKKAIMHAHTCETYYYWINSMYYGEYGWISHDDNGNPAIKNTSVVIPDKVTRIGGYCFEHCINIKSLTIPDSTISCCDLSTLTGLRTLTIPIDIYYGIWGGVSDSVMTINFTPGRTGKMLNDSSSNDYGAQTSLAKVTFAEGITYIGSYAFYGYKALTSVTLPSTLLAIGNGAFKNCTALKSLKLPSNIIEIGDSAFQGCTNLSSVNLPDSIMSLEDYCFSGCTKLKINGIPGKIKNIGKSCFNGCTNLLSSVVLPDTIETIGSNAFNDVTSLTDVTMPCDGECVKNPIFTCSNYGGEPNNIVNITLTKGNTGKVLDTWDTTESSYFSESRYPTLNKITLSEGITAIGKGSFIRACESEISLPSTLKEIGDYAFSENANLTGIIIPNKVASIGNHAFYDCSSLISLTLPPALEAIPEGMCYNCTLLDGIIIPGKVTTVGRDAFQNCASIKEIVFPKKVSFIGGSYGDNMGESIKVLNPECEFDSNRPYYFGKTIYGYDGSTAESFAKDHNLTFISLGAAPEADTSVYCDVNDDGIFNIADVVILQEWLAAVPDTTLDNWKAADLCEDGKLNVIDLCMMKRMLIKNS